MKLRDKNLFVVPIVPIFAENINKMNDSKNTCFVCKSKITSEDFGFNKEVLLPVCRVCAETPKEKEAVEELLDSLADGLICGCI